MYESTAVLNSQRIIPNSRKMRKKASFFRQSIEPCSDPSTKKTITEEKSHEESLFSEQSRENGYSMEGSKRSQRESYFKNEKKSQKQLYLSIAPKSILINGRLFHLFKKQF